MSRRVVLVLLLLFGTGAAFGDDTINFKGYYKNLLITSRTSFPLEENYTLDLNRLRLEASGRPAEWFAFDVQYDNEVFLGSFLDTAQFRLLKATPPATYWDLEDIYLDRGSIVARQRLHRGFLTFNTPVADVIVGRQRIAWGSGHFWNPTDLFNPFNPIAIEREERTGVDAVLLQRNLGPLSRVSLAYAPQRDAPSSRAVQYRTNVSSTDAAVMAGEFRGDRVVGLDLVGKIGDGGLRLEAAGTNPELGKSYARAVTGFDYAFPNTLTLSLEYYYNGQGTRDPRLYDFPRLQANLIQNVGQHYAGAQTRYELTPLLRWDNYFIENLNDKSRFFSPAITYSVMTNLDWSVGVQLFGGEAGTEYASFHNLFYTYVQYFF